MGLDISDGKDFWMVLPAIVKECLAFEGIILAGGALRSLMDGKRPRDYDLFCFNQETVNLVLLLLEKKGRTIGEQGGTKKFIVDDREIEVITEIFSSPNKVLESFDFRCSQVGIYKECVISIPGALDDIKEKILTYCGTNFPEHTWKSRIPKFVCEYGYSISAHDVMAVLKDIGNKKVCN